MSLYSNTSLSNNQNEDFKEINYSQHLLKYSAIKQDILHKDINYKNLCLSSKLKENNYFLFLQKKEKTDEIELNITLKTSEKESTIELVQFYINLISNKTPSLIIKLTNINNPLFLYILELSKIEYEQFKSEQNLLMNFENFPEYFLKMLNLCKNDRENKYSCTLNLSNGEKNNPPLGILTIEEKTQYKKLIHLSLKLKNANDENLKNHLKTIIKDYKDNCDSLSQKFNEILNEFENYQNENENLKEKYQKLEIEYKTVVDNILNEKKKEIDEIKDNYDLEMKKQLDLLEMKKNDEIINLEKKISQLEKNLKDITKNNNQLETTKKELEEKYSKSFSELSAYKSEKNGIYKENSELNQKNINNENKIIELNLKIENFSKQLEEKNKKIDNLNQLIENLNKQKDSNEDIIKSLKANNLKLENRLTQSNKEINKANIIISTKKIHKKN